jgi:type IV pilus assembly protein PilW
MISQMRLHRRSKRPIRHQAGLTLIELMVALVLGLLIAAAAVAALIIARTGFTSVDNSAQLRENARFASSLIQRIVVQAGFENAAYGLISESGAKQPGLRGYDDALVGNVSAVAVTAEPPLAHATRTGTCAVTDTSCLNGSDVLMVRFWGVSRVPGGAADGSMINCAGVAESEGTDRAYSIFHVARSTSGEPTLACTYRTATGWSTVPLVTGVEAFQVLYGVDTRDAAGATGTDSVADRYLTATQLDSIPGSVVVDNWRRVRTVRIGLVIRGNAPNAVDRAATAQTIPVLGTGFTATSDTRSNLAVPADGRLRQTLVFSVHLRNAQFSP